VAERISIKRDMGRRHRDRKKLYTYG